MDSSIVAWLLRQRGENIAGMFMNNWEDDEIAGGHGTGDAAAGAPAASPCTAGEDAADARRVAEIPGIEFHGRNFATEYWNEAVRFLSAACFAADKEEVRAALSGVHCSFILAVLV